MIKNCGVVRQIIKQVCGFIKEKRQQKFRAVGGIPFLMDLEIADAAAVISNCDSRRRLAAAAESASSGNSRAGRVSTAETAETLRCVSGLNLRISSISSPIKITRNGARDPAGKNINLSADNGEFARFTDAVGAAIAAVNQLRKQIFPVGRFADAQRKRPRR